MREWYNLEDHLFSSNATPVQDDLSGNILQQSDEENGGEVLLETDSENGAATASDSDGEGGILLETDSENESRPVDDPPTKKRKYTERKCQQLLFLNKPVCKHAHARLFGVSSNAMQKVRQGKAAYTMHENRLPEPKHKVLGTSLLRDSGNMKWPNVLSFFFLLYTSCAEILPTKLTMPKGQKFESYIDADQDFEERYTRSFMADLERHSGLDPVSWQVPFGQTEFCLICDCTLSDKSKLIFCCV